MKRLATYFLVIATFVFLLPACGSKTKEKGGQNQVTKETGTSDNSAKDSNTKPAGDAALAVASGGKGEEIAKSPGTKDGKTVEGTFTGLEQGDLFYFNMKDGAGKDRSFTVMKPDAVYEKISASPEKFKGKKIKVYYKKVKKYIENAGADVEFEEYIKAELL